MSTLTYIIAWPLVAAFAALHTVPRNYRFVMRLVAVAVTSISMLLAVKIMFCQFGSVTPNADGFRFVQDHLRGSA